MFIKVKIKNPPKPVKKAKTVKSKFKTQKSKFHLQTHCVFFFFLCSSFYLSFHLYHLLILSSNSKKINQIMHIYSYILINFKGRQLLKTQLERYEHTICF